MLQDVLKKLANNYFSKEVTVIGQNDISNHGTVPLILQHASVLCPSNQPKIFPKPP